MTLSDAPATAAEAYDDIAPAPPWARYWARFLDIQVNSLIVILATGLVFPALLLGLANGPGGDLVIGLFTLPFALVLDALCQALIGGTLGKAIAGVKVVTLRGERLGLALALRRNFGVYVRGLFLGIPLLSLFGMMSMLQRVRDGRRLAPWDEALFTRPRLNGGNIYRTLLTAALTMALTAGALAFAQFAEAPRPGAPPVSAADMAADLPALNKDLPKKVDAETTFERIGFENNVSVYEYVIDNGLSAEAVGQNFDRNGVGTTLRTRFCDARKQDPLRDTGFPSEFRYRTKSGAPIRTYRFSLADCR